MIKILFQFSIFIFPWRVRRFLLRKFLHFEIGRNARIGYSIILAHKVVLGDDASIGHLNFCKPIDLLYLGQSSNIGTRNYITGFSIVDKRVLKYKYFAHIRERQCVLKIGKHTGVTSRHYFDCNGGIYIGDYCQVAGFETSFLTHSIDLINNRQDADCVRIGDYCFIGTRCTFLKGAEIPSYTVVGACSLVNKKYEEGMAMYAGVPCRFIKKVTGLDFFTRKVGFVK
jgi:acetyltransferase-like isoleucine patch superfamily enzyme